MTDTGQVLSFHLGERKVLNEPSLQANECKDHPAVQLERKRLLFGAYCTQTEGFWFQLHLDYVSEEPDPLRSVAGAPCAGLRDPLGFVTSEGLVSESNPHVFLGEG